MEGGFEGKVVVRGITFKLVLNMFLSTRVCD